MKRQGFTLIELLAVIVIIAVVALITIPMILNVIEEARKNSYKESARGYVDAIEKRIVKEQLKNTNTDYTGEYSIREETITKTSETATLIPILDTISLQLKIKGTLPDRGNVVIDKKGVTSGKFYYGDYLVTLNGEKYNVEIVTNGSTDSSSDTSALEARIDQLEKEMVANKTALENRIKELEGQALTGKYETIYEGSATSGTYALTKSVKDYKYLIVYTDSTKHNNVSSWKSTFNDSVVVDTSKLQYSVSTYVSSPYYNASWYYFIHFTFTGETNFQIIEMYKAGVPNPRIYKIVGVK